MEEKRSLLMDTIAQWRDPAGNIIPAKNAKLDRRDLMRTSGNF